tara:strand:- start:1037 stop:1774 length:738 start_codon:yes stop_codon:yes gene_type:complete
MRKHTSAFPSEVAVWAFAFMVVATALPLYAQAPDLSGAEMAAILHEDWGASRPAYLEIARTTGSFDTGAIRQTARDHFRLVVLDELSEPMLQTLEVLRQLAEIGFLNRMTDELQYSRHVGFMGDTEEVSVDVEIFDLTDAGSTFVERNVSHDWVSGSRDGFRIGNYEIAEVVGTDGPESTFLGDVFAVEFRVRFVDPEPWYNGIRTQLEDIGYDDRLPESGDEYAAYVEFFREEDGWVAGDYSWE